MAINFPSSPGDGEEYTDVNSGTWVYDSGTNSWTLTAAGSASAFNFRGGHDFTQATPPAAPIESGDLWVHDGPAGTVNGVYNGLTGTIPEGQLVLWDGSKYVAVASAPGYPDLGDGGGSTLDDRYVNATGDNMTGDLTLGTDKITLDATDGSAKFAGEIRYEGSGDNYGLVVNKTGGNSKGIYIGTASTTDNSDLITAQSGYGGDGVVDRFTVKADGSATFAGKYTGTFGSSDAYSASMSSVPTTFIEVRNSATAASNMAFMTFRGSGASSSTVGAWSIGQVGSSTSNGLLNKFAFVQRTASNTYKERLILDESGDAKFAGEVKAARLVADDPAVTGLTSITTNDAPAGAKGFGVFNTDTNESTLSLYKDGSANFAGDIEANNVTFKLEPDNDDNYTVTTEEYEEQEELTPYVPAVDPVVGPLGNVLVEGTPAVEATYQTVTKTREIRTYTGPTLDVKTVIQDLQQRVNDRDAVIADLTTRIAALEAA